MAICKNTFKAAYRYIVPERPAGDVAEAGRLPMLPRRCRLTWFFTVTFRRKNGGGPARGASEAGRLITKSRRWWKKAAFPGTCQSTKGQVCG